MAETKIIKPQPGYQMIALSSKADIVIGGGSAGAGKTFSLLLDPMRHFNNSEFGGVIFRRLTTQIKAQGGLWDESQKLYPLVGGAPNKTELHWEFPSGSRIKFSHLEHEKNVNSWQGSQIPFIGFDELTHFSKDTFFYLLSRNRSTSGIKPFVRCTCNPDPDSWVYEIIAWWIGEDGFPIPERQGIVRYFVKDGETLIWGSTVDETLEKADYFVRPLAEKANIDPSKFVKSLTFIGGSVYENEELLKSNPEYLANLAAQSEEARKQLMDGNWKVSVNPMDIYDYNSFKDAFTNTHVNSGVSRIIIDVALGGEDKLIISYFKGHIWADIIIVSKSSGKDIIDIVNDFKQKYKVRNSNIVYDADGVGGFIGGGNNAFISGAYAFHNGSKAIPTEDKRKFDNLKTQCYVYSGERMERGETYISEKVANTMYDDKTTVRQRLNLERKAIKKRIQVDNEPLKLIPKKEMKQKYLSGSSPDLLDNLMMNEAIDIKPKKAVISNSLTAQQLGLV